MPRGVWKVLLWTSLAMLFRCCGALSSGRLSVVPAPQPEPSLWWSLYGGEATMTLGFYCRFKRNVWHRADATGGLKSAPVDLSGHAVSLLRCSVFWASFCSPGAKTWAITMVESLWWRSYQGLRFLLSIQAQRLTSGGCQGGSEKRSCGPLCALSSGRLSVLPAPKPEPSLWWSLYGGEATKALGIYCRFKRNVWLRADAKGGLKSASVDLSGHAVSLLRCFVFWAAKTLGFYCGFKRNVWHRADATGGLKSAPVDLSGHAVSLLRRSVFSASFCSPGAKTWAITMVESLLYVAEATKTLGFYCGFKRNVWHRAHATGGLKSVPVDLSGHAVSLLRCSVFWASFCSPGAKTWAITMVESLLYGAEATKTLGFYCGFKRNVWHRADATGGLKSAPVDLSGHAVSLLRCSVFWASFCSPR